MTNIKYDASKLINRLYVAILLVIFGGIVLHAPLSVGLGTLWPDYDLLIKSWKEILMLVAGLIALFLLYKSKRFKLLRDPIIRPLSQPTFKRKMPGFSSERSEKRGGDPIGSSTSFEDFAAEKTGILAGGRLGKRSIIAITSYAVLHLILATFINGGLASILAGLAIDLRYLFFFGLVYIAIILDLRKIPATPDLLSPFRKHFSAVDDTTVSPPSEKMSPELVLVESGSGKVSRESSLHPDCRRIFIKVGVIGALIVLIFALLQVFILPHDILKYIGYNINTISPYLTVDQNQDFIRINSTLRGPNPLGAYASIVLALIVAAITKCKFNKGKWLPILAIILSIGGIVALWFSYSRSALVGTIIAIVIILIVAIVPRISLKLRIAGAVTATLVISAAGILMASNAQFMSNVLLHDNPIGGSSVNSNEGHIASIQTSLDQSLQQPFGAGIGSTGSASLYGKNPVIIENQYLFIAHETGWLGLSLFIFIFGMILTRLWKLRQDWLALGVFASGIGLALIGLLLPVWVDDTVAIIWWGLAAIALGSQKR